MYNNHSKDGGIVSKKTKFILSILLFIIVIGFAIKYYYDNYYGRNKYLTPEVKEIIKENKKTYDKVKEEQPVPTPSIEKYTNKLPTYRSTYNNPYIYGELIIPGIKMNSLITRANNNEYYISHNLYNNYDILGTPFFDYRNKSLATSSQINIYGHNTENSNYYDQLPFTKLEAYIDIATFKTAKEITLNIDEKSMKYKVIAVKIIEHNNNEHTKVLFKDNNDFLNHSKKLLSNTLYKEDADIKGNDRLLVLQACHYNPRGSYILVIAKKV